MLLARNVGTEDPRVGLGEQCVVGDGAAELRPLGFLHRVGVDKRTGSFRFLDERRDELHLHFNGGDEIRERPIRAEHHEHVGEARCRDAKVARRGI